MNVYVSQSNVDASIEYFKNIGLDSDDMLFLFLMSKHLGITSSTPVTYSVGKLSDTQKSEYLSCIWQLAGLFDSTEISNKRGLMFPTGFARLSAYQPGTDFNSMIGRIKDTIEKKNHNVPIYDDKESVLTLRGNYRELIMENYLKGNKISLAHFTAWLFRFTKFDFDTMPNDKQFTRVLERAVRKFMRLTKNDFLWLFENDLSINRITPANTGVTGSYIRSLFSFDAGKEPEIIAGTASSVYQVSEYSRDDVEKYLALNGDNPSDKDIFETLKLKKQIVLTGVPGVGKSRYTDNLCKNGFFKEYKMIQFHASYSYEDFIGSETLKSTLTGPEVITRKGVFLNFVQKANDHPTDNYLFIIDELNRGNIAEIFGETILALDRNYEAELSKNYDGVDKLKIPENLYIVATMNTSDRNIAFLDLAIRRRFAFIPLYPNYDFLSETVEFASLDLGVILRVINQRVVATLKDSELVLGQSYFIPPETGGKYEWTMEQFKNQFNYVLLPTIKEYSFNDASAVNAIVGEQLCDGIQDTDDFAKALVAEFFM